MGAGKMNLDSIDIMSFLSVWHTESGSSAVGIGSEFDWIPDGLKRWYELSLRWGLPREGVKRLLHPSDFSEEEGKVIFMSDQGGWAWSFDPAAPLDVYEAKDDEPWTKIPGDWESIFLWYVFTETIESAPFVQWGSNIPAGDAERILSMFRKVTFPNSRWPNEGWGFYVADGVIADAGPSEWIPGVFSITVGAISSEFTEFLDSFTDVEWRKRQRSRTY
ncbi:hypothetical protein ABZ926_14965 [Streptomyces litmocidini]|uniref:hypothetical protein n=1 Tax=Streptomyces litmocidini TaxID=67318 RepID=UPI0033D4427D